MILADEHGAHRSFRNANEWLRAFKKRHSLRLRGYDRNFLTDILHDKGWHRQGKRFSFWRFTLHYTKTNAFARGVRHPRTTVGRTQKSYHRGMESTPKHPIISIGTPDRVRLVHCFIRSIPVKAPLCQISMHVMQAPCIRGLFCHSK